MLGVRTPKNAPKLHVLLGKVRPGLQNIVFFALLLNIAPKCPSRAPFIFWLTPLLNKCKVDGWFPYLYASQKTTK